MDVSHQRYNLKAPYLKQRQYYTLSFFWGRSISRLSAKKRKQYGWGAGTNFVLSQMLYSTITHSYKIKMCYEFEISENVKLTSKKALEKEDNEAELELEPIKVSN